MDIRIPFIRYVQDHQKHRKSPKKLVLVGMLSLAFVCYPFVRFSLDIPGIYQKKPTEERTERILKALLTNLYRSFETRNEKQVYDRLARSVLGDQLTPDLFAKQTITGVREQRGARATVDGVMVQGIDGIARTDVKDAFSATVTWLVSGLVNHFGHTHYRKNHYEAELFFRVDDGKWNVYDIVLLDEKKLL